MIKEEDLGQMLVTDGTISNSDLERAKSEQKVRRESLVRTLVSLNIVNENKMIEFLSRKLGIPKVNLSKVVGIDPKVANLIPISMAEAHLVFSCF